ncbi:FGFR1 oncogene partner 2 homolog [Strongylocentrotus purpuratus]|uniref:FGFR1 oncogene partner 2 homolog n=1 Tax=Strongylocentrotus purpuratus TaxID=7668 RepID=A0A7M7RF36_STRPU|nr:FGFR1 oncogene partner 2 homolog [Strongylocentrotus purpuratus]|eukprot:XP_786805.2 PREDICTED: FGFR1 oncogene partner 2 homolog [Strongylocentrotus purpuratus]
MMTLSIDMVLSDARRLVERLKEHDSAADHLIQETTTLNKKIEVMKEYQEEIEEMNNIARHRPRSALILGIQQENRQIRELQKENQELRVALEEHQSALDLIMSSYRDQVSRLVNANQAERDNMLANQKTLDFEQDPAVTSIEKIIEMAAVMQRAINVDEQTSYDVEETLARLQMENRGLRELLQISRTTQARHLPTYGSEGSVDLGEREKGRDDDAEKDNETSESDSDKDTSVIHDTTIIQKDKNGVPLN